MNLRLQSLLRQRELLREHLRWLDDEIAAAGSPSSETRPAAPTPTPATAAVAPTQAAPTIAGPTLATRALDGPARFAVSDPNEKAALELMPEPDKKSIHDEVKRGCLLYAAIAFAGFAAVIAAAYWMR